ncbi:DUF6632 domain-containing protein [Mesorhizobium sp. M0220]|uniref:DUF6632 domain-containing protein n=1 Tax=Mesorhizobium sp. M0220 TaxID=2956920 RepID=UPI003335679A
MRPQFPVGTRSGIWQGYFDVDTGCRCCLRDAWRRWHGAAEPSGRQARGRRTASFVDLRPGMSGKLPRNFPGRDNHQRAHKTVAGAVDPPFPPTTSRLSGDLQVHLEHALGSFQGGTPKHGGHANPLAAPDRHSIRGPKRRISSGNDRPPTCGDDPQGPPWPLGPHFGALRARKAKKMKSVTDREKWLGKFLLVYGCLSLVLFGTLSIGLFFHLPAFGKGGALNWTVWDDMSDHVPLMITVIYFVWSIFLIRSSRAPSAHASFLDFTMWANLAHGLIMIPQALDMNMYHSKFMTDIPWVLLLAGAIGFLRTWPATGDVKAAAP